MDSPQQFQVELIQLQANDHIKAKFVTLDTISSYRFLHKAFPQEFSKIKMNAYNSIQVISMFGSTYKCELLFSALKITKSRNRSTLSDEHFNDCMKICNANNLKPDFDRIAKTIQHHPSH